MRRAPIIALLGLLACAGTNDFNVDVRFSPWELNSIGRAAEQWERATDSPDAVLSLRTGVVLRAGSEFVEDDWEREIDGRVGLFRVQKEESGYIEMVEKYGDFVGLSLEGGPMIVVETYGWNDDLLTRIVLHELGHHFGLHNGASPVMAEFVEQFPACLTLEDVEVFCTDHKCGSMRATCP